MMMKKYLDVLWAIHKCGNLCERTFCIEADAPTQKVCKFAKGFEVLDVGRMTVIAGIRRPGDILPIMRRLSVRGIRARAYAEYHEGGDICVLGVNR